MLNKKLIDNVFINMAYLYIILPIVIFLLGWCAWYIAIPGTAVFVICFIRICKNNTITLPDFEWTKKDVEKVGFIIGISALWVYFSGVGAFVWQNSDHLCRNAIFEVLVNYDWPVVSEMTIGGMQQNRGLAYYTGFWLPAAIVGKIFGVTMGYCFQAAWAVLGICLFYYLICVLRKKIQIWPLVLFIFMSGLDIWGYYISGGDLETLSRIDHIEWWSTYYQFSGFTTQLFWVFNQAVPAWLIFMLLYLQKNNRYSVFILGCALLPTTFAFVGMIPFFLYFMLSRKYEGVSFGKKAWWNKFCKDTFTFDNILGGGIAGIIPFIYLTGNVAAQNIESTATTATAVATTIPSVRWKIMVWVVFIIVEVGVYWLAIYKYQKKNALFYIMIVWLCFCPWVRVGGAMDFCMRTSIPSLLVLYLLVVNSLELSYIKKDYLIVGTLIVLLAIGSVTSTNEINRTVTKTKYQLDTNTAIVGERFSDEIVFTGYNFSCDVDNSIFFKYFARK